MIVDELTNECCCPRGIVGAVMEVHGGSISVLRSKRYDEKVGTLRSGEDGRMVKEDGYRYRQGGRMMALSEARAFYLEGQ